MLLLISSCERYVYLSYRAYDSGLFLDGMFKICLHLVYHAYENQRSSFLIKCSPMKSTSLKFLHLSSRYDPNIDIPMDVDGQNDRVIFIKSVAQFMVCTLFYLTNESVSFAALPRYISCQFHISCLLDESVPL